MFSAFVLGLLLASYPYVPPKEDVFFSNIAWTVNYEMEGRRVFYTAAGTLILLALVQEPLLQTLLETPVPRYFGRISYSCYLIHGLVIRLIGGRIPAFKLEDYGYRRQSAPYRFLFGLHCVVSFGCLGRRSVRESD